MRAREQIYDRNRTLIQQNMAALTTFCKKYPQFIEWKQPVGGPICFPKLLLPSDGGVLGFCKRLVDDAGVMLLPDTVYGIDTGHFRMGLGRKNFVECLDLVGTFLDK